MSLFTNMLLAAAFLASIGLAIWVFMRNRPATVALETSSLRMDPFEAWQNTDMLRYWICFQLGLTMLVVALSLNLYENTLVKDLVSLALALLALIPLGYALHVYRKARLEMPNRLFPLIRVAFQKPYQKRLLLLVVWNVVLVSLCGIIAVRFLILLAFNV